ncbi:MAG: hypothetical protein PHD54_09630 [Desulfuromonadaceae bacterium]|nr:hypothetical protein [Desulfuromonadaceae bacterium]
MTLKKSVCSHCGKVFEADSGGSVYSIKNFNDTCQLEIIVGELISGARHYCTDRCMFDREQDTLPYDHYLEQYQGAVIA